MIDSHGLVSQPETVENRTSRIGEMGTKGFGVDKIRRWLSEAGFVPHIRARGEEAKPCPDRPGYRPRRWVVERTHGWFHRYRRIHIRWEKKVENYMALLHFVSGIIAFQQAGLFGIRANLSA